MTRAFILALGLANYRVGAPVIHELLKDWGRYQNAIRQAAFE